MTTLSYLIKSPICIYYPVFGYLAVEGGFQIEKVWNSYSTNIKAKVGPNNGEKIKINEVESSFFSKKFFAERPKSENLINSALNKKGLNLMRPWKETLKEYINKYYLDYI